MRFSLHIALCAGAFLVCAASGQAAEALSLQQAIQQAVAGSPILKSAAERVASFQGSVVQAGLKPNPRLVVQQENFRSWDFSHQEPGQPPGFVYLRDTDTYVYGAQIVERGHKRQRRVDFASSVRDRVDLERDLLEQQIRARVASAYWTALSAAKIRDLSRADSDTFGRIVEDQRNRVREGAAPGADLLRMQVEQQRLSASFQSAAADANRARIALLREMGRSEFPELDLTESLEALPRMSLKDLPKILSQRRDAQVASHAVQQAEANARLQRANAKMDPEIQFGYKRTAGFDTLYAAVNVPVALHNRNQGNIASADADVRTAQGSLAAVTRQIRAEVESARADYEAKRRVVSDTLRPLLGDAQRSLEITEGAYREGGFDLLRYLDAQRARIEAQTLYYRGLGELHQSAVAVEQAQGDFQ